MQQATVQLGKIAVQAIVNTLGINAMAAFTAASRVDDFTEIASFLIFTDYHDVAAFLHHVCLHIRTFCQHQTDDITSFQ